MRDLPRHEFIMIARGDGKAEILHMFDSGAASAAQSSGRRLARLGRK